MSQKRRIILGISGASGAIYAIRLLQMLAQNAQVETHLVITQAGEQTLKSELGIESEAISRLAFARYAIDDIAAPIASGSFLTGGMVVLPCSIKTLSGIAHCYSQNLLLRAADVTLKERRPLILGVRETPLHLGHLRLMTQAAEMGAVIAPPIPAFYHSPGSIEDLVHHYLCRVLDWLGLPCPSEEAHRWQGSHSLPGA